MKTFITILSCCFFLISSANANQSNIDSLKTILLSPKDDSTYVAVLQNIAKQFSQKNTDSLLHYNNLAYQHAKNQGYTKGIISSAQALGAAYYRAGDYELAYPFFEESKKLSRQTEDYPNMFYAISYIAFLDRTSGQSERALKIAQDGLDLADSLNYLPGRRKMLQNLGSLYRWNQEGERAIGYFNKALAINDSLVTPYNKYSLTQRLALAYDISGKEEKAIDLLKNTFKDYGQHMQSADSARTLDNIGRIYHIISEYDSSRFYLYKSYDIQKRLNHPADLAHILNELLTVYKKEKKYEKALYYGKLTMETASLKNNVYTVMHMNRHLSEIHAALGNFKEAYHFQLEHDILEDSIYDVNKARTIAQMSSQYETAIKEKQLLEQESQIQLLEQDKRLAVLQRNRLIGAALFAIILFGLFWYNRNIKKEKEAIVLKIKLLRSQINPHFIFNALTSIYGFMDKNDSSSTKSYLTKFARLMRAILEHSEESKVSLDEEIDFLKNYLDLEQLRFDFQFQYKIEIDDEVEEEFLMIPPMLIQPYIENAIIHGLRGVDDGEIHLKFLHPTEGVLLCIIEDNGIGISNSRNRNQLNEAKQKDLGKTRSMGTSITQQRLEAINKRSQKPISVNVRNQTSSNKTGTRVEINIPIAV